MGGGSFTRVVTENVIMALIAGTATQLGAIALVLSKFLVPATDGDAG